MAALRFRYATPTASHGAGGNHALTNYTDHSVGAGHSKQKTAEEKQASCQSSIKIVQENAVGDAVMAIADLYKRTNDPLACAGKDWSDRGLPFDIWQTLEIYKKQGIWLENCDKETIERDLPLGVAEMRFIFNHRIYNKKAKEDFRECRARLVYEPE